MKKVLLLLSLACLFAGCALPPKTEHLIAIEN